MSKISNKFNSLIRLNKWIAECGLTSRRGADQLIESGQVMVNGKKVYELGIQVNPKMDKIVVQGKPLPSKRAQIYAMLHKPKGVLTTMSDPSGRPTIVDYLQKGELGSYRLFPVGRLDWDSEGLVLLTNDGNFAHKVMHPQGEVTKTYLVKVNGQPKPEHINKLLKGVSIIGGKVKAKYVEKISRGVGKYDWYKVIITEGKNRQIRQMFAKIGLDVMKLQRIAIGRLRLGRLQRGKVVFLNDVAVERVFLPDQLSSGI